MMHKVKYDVHRAFEVALQDPRHIMALHTRIREKQGAIEGNILSTTTTQATPEEAVTQPSTTITEWLAKLNLLEGIPFNYLVAEEAMLPKESIRFFYIDSNWVTALVDGAYSLGSSTQAERVHDKAFANKIHQKATQLAHQHRARIMGSVSASPQATDQNIVTGFLLRSVAVSAFPGLEIEGKNEKGVDIAILRMEHLSKDILFGLFTGELHTLKMYTPSEGLHFGLDRSERDGFTKSLKKMNAVDATKNGAPIDDSEITISQDYYRNDKSVLKINKLATAINEKLKGLGQSGVNFTSAEFALQMIEGVDMAVLSSSDET